MFTNNRGSELLGFGQPPGGIMQVAFIVPDLKAALGHYSEQLSCGPWFVFEHFPLNNYRHRGSPSELDIDIAMAYSGSMCFELIQQNCDNDSVYREVQQKKGWGFHHWAVASMDFDADVEQYAEKGNELALYGEAGPGARAGYIDTTNVLPGMIELIEINDNVEALFKEMYDQAASWDGHTHAVRTL